MVTLSHYLILGGILFAISILGIFLNRKNIILIFRNYKSINVADVNRLKE